MNQLSKIEMAKLVITEDVKSKITNMLCSFYGATDVQYCDLTYGIGINISGSSSFRFIKSAIVKVLNVTEDTIGVLGESDKNLTASYVYLPEKDKNLQRKLKKNK